MPLLILGLLLLIGLLAYSVISYMNDVQVDDRPVRERYPHAFPVYPPKEDKDGEPDSDKEEAPVDAESYYDEDSLRGDIDYMIRNLKEGLRQRTENINLDLDSIKKRFSGNGSSSEDEDDDNTVEFPRDNIENEKKKRGINSD